MLFSNWTEGAARVTGAQVQISFHKLIQAVLVVFPFLLWQVQVHQQRALFQKNSLTSTQANWKLIG